ncbi:hypothetical protein [Mucilaginibacter antarcticus]|uniref:hypothetical protein n=2 Tax=Mucilaginibacter antarcticus TaxID=1855725 RepID=UPI0036290BBA
MKKLKLSLDQLTIDCNPISDLESISTKGGTDWVTDFFNSHDSGTYTSADWTNNSWDVTPEHVVDSSSHGSNGFFFDSGVA